MGAISCCQNYSSHLGFCLRLHLLRVLESTKKQVAPCASCYGNDKEYLLPQSLTSWILFSISSWLKTYHFVVPLRRVPSSVENFVNGAHREQPPQEGNCSRHCCTEVHGGLWICMPVMCRETPVSQIALFMQQLLLFGLAISWFWFFRIPVCKRDI